MAKKIYLQISSLGSYFTKIAMIVPPFISMYFLNELNSYSATPFLLNYHFYFHSQLDLYRIKCDHDTLTPVCFNQDT